MYEQSYADISEKIRQGRYSTPVSESAQSLVPRPSAKVESSTEPKEDLTSTLMAYMIGLKNKTSEVRESLPQITTPTLDGDIGRALNALGTIESSGNYHAIGPVTQKGNRAYGKYQVMDFNIPSWTKEVLGTSMTPQEFLSNPDAQEAVAAAKMQSYYDKHGTWEDAASIWFSGRPLSKAGNASDGFNTVPEYVTKFRRHF